MENRPKETPRIYIRFNSPEKEYRFKSFSGKTLILEYPAGSFLAGKDWRIGIVTVRRWMAIGVLRIVGTIPGLTPESGE